MRQLVWGLALAVVLSATTAFAQDSECSDMPKTGPDAAKSFLAFDKFNKELRAALTTNDTLAMALLVKFPLRVNDGQGTLWVNPTSKMFSLRWCARLF